MRRLILFLTILLVGAPAIGWGSPPCELPLCQDDPWTWELVEDRVDTLIQDGTGVTWTYDDGANTLTGNVDFSAYAKLDGSNGPTTGEWQYDHDIYGPDDACSGTSFSIDSGPAVCASAPCSGVDADTVDTGDCASGEGAYIVTENFSHFGALCSEGPAVDVPTILAENFTYGTDGLRICIFDSGSLGLPPGDYTSVMLPTSDTCEQLATNLGGATIRGQDVWFSYDPEACAYGFVGDALSLVSGWSDPPSITDDGYMVHEWDISNAGELAAYTFDFTGAGAIGTGNDAYPHVTRYKNQAGLFVHTVFDDIDHTHYDPVENYWRSGLTFLNQAYVEESWNGVDAYPIIYGVRGVQISALVGGDQVSQTIGVLAENIGVGNGLVDQKTGVMVGVGANDAGVTVNDLIAYDMYIYDVGTNENVIGLNIPGDFLSGNTSSRGIKIGTPTDPNALGIDSAADTKLSGDVILDNLPAETGTTQYVCVDGSGNIMAGAACN